MALEYFEFAKNDRLGPDWNQLNMTELFHIEEAFQLNIFVYELIRHNTPTVYRPSPERHQTTMYVNWYEGHVSYVSNLNGFRNAYHCPTCMKNFNREWLQKRHTATCTLEINLKFRRGGFALAPTVFEELDDYNINIPADDRYYPYRATWDWESYQQPLLGQSTAKRDLMAEPIPASVAVASNVPGYTDVHVFISDGDSAQLVKHFHEYIEEISIMAFQLMNTKFGWVITELDARRIAAQEQLHYWTLKFNVDPRYKLEFQRAQYKKWQSRKTDRIKERFQRWLRQLICLGFNCKAYDIYLIRKYWFPILKPNLKGLIKKGRDYIMISTESLHFLDITSYLAAGTSYDKWIKSYDIAQTKGWFAHDWFHSLDQLDDVELPPHASFYSQLKNSNITDYEYAQLQATWRSEGWQTARQWLAWYNALDVVPFLAAVDKMCAEWKTKQICMFKQDAISLPGLSFRYMFQQLPQYSYFFLWGEKWKEWHHKLRNSIVGGPSIIFHRYAEKDVTNIRGNPLYPVKKIVGFDATALYCFALGLPMPCGEPVFWYPVEKENDPLDQLLDDLYSDDMSLSDHYMQQEFTRTRAEPFGGKELEWLCWMEHTLGYKVEHRLTGRRQVFKVGDTTLIPDGFIKELGVVLQYHGCRYHPHRGCRKKLGNDPNQQERQNRTERVRELYTKVLKFGYIEEYECEFDHKRRCNSQINEFIQQHLDMPNKWRRRMTAASIAQCVKMGSFFGLVECDVYTPSELKDKFSEMCPIFKHAQVGRDDIGQFMSDHAEQHNLMRSPEKMLIGSYFAQKQLIITPLLRWYLDNGLKIGRVYCAIQFKPKRCFQHLVDEVAADRRAADQSSAHKMRGECAKLRGNRFYGRTLACVEQYGSVTLVGPDKVGKKINNKRFKSLDEINEDTFEVNMEKSRINVSLPLAIGVFVYGYAKLRMLEFYYAFLDRYIPRETRQMMLMDTDSAYLAISGDSLDDLVKPELQHEYLIRGKPSFLATNKWDEREPGLFKLEYEGDALLALNSKTYIGLKCDGSAKMSTKGIQKNKNNFTFDQFKNVLDSRNSMSGVNKGFLIDNGILKMYTQSRLGLSFFYGKRKVQNDCISTIPLEL